MRLNDAGAGAEPIASPAPAGGVARRAWDAVARGAARVDRSSLALGAVAIAALWMRLYDINWDANNHLHPDERAITLVVQCLGLHSAPPGCPAVSDPANPHFFAYGSFPLYLLALVSNGLAHLFAGWHGLPTDGGTFNDYNHITLVGRALSALFDTGTALVAGLIARRLVGRWWGVFAAAFVAVTTFEVQISHFYAVDTVLTFFTTLAIFGALGLAGLRRADGTDPLALEGDMPPTRFTLAWSLLTGLALGLAITSKVSAAPLVAPIALALVVRWRRLGWGAWTDIAMSAIATATTAFVTIILTMPYAFLDATEFWRDVNEQSALAKGTVVYPYTIQFANTTPYLYQLKNIFIWDLGPTLTLAGIAGVLYALWRVWRRWDDILLVPLAWVLIYFGITGDFYTKYSRYEVPIFPILAVLAAVALAALFRSTVRLPQWSALRRFEEWPPRQRFVAWRPDWPRWLAAGLAGVTLAGGLLWTLAFLQIYTQPVTRVTASEWIYAHVPAGSIITHEVWDDALPLQVGNDSPYIYHWEDLNLYDTDTTTKATQLAQQIATADVIVLSSARLVKSITNVPAMYPLTTNYYHLLFAGKLGFALAHAPFANEPHLGPFRLPDASADESFSVYDHPTVWIFTRSGPRLTASQIDTLLMQGVSLPPQETSLASQKPLLLSAQAQAADNTSPPLWREFNPAGLATKLALPLWWLAIEILGLLVFPLVFLALPGLRDRGWGLSKAVGVLALSYVVWLPASLGVWPYERLTVWLTAIILAIAGGLVGWRRRADLLAFWRQRRRLLIATEIITLAAFLVFVAIRSADPDLWNIYRGGEKPMELAFLNGILRSRSLPPLDPWFAGGYINYYYFGQFLIATLIQLTGVVPTTAFNLAIPMLFALTIAGALSVVGGVARRLWIGVAGGWFLAVTSNLDGLHQYVNQLQAATAGQPVPPFDYWASSRVIQRIVNGQVTLGTINEFPLWSFLYADLHAHVIDLPIVLIGLGVAASLLMEPRGSDRVPWATLALGALALGAMACINTWDAPTYGVIVVVALLLSERRWMTAAASEAGGGWRAWAALVTWPRVRRVALSVIGLGVAAIGLYLPFYTHFQSFVSSIGPVTQQDDLLQFLTIFGLWLFLITSWFLVELHAWWEGRIARRWSEGLLGDRAQRVLAVVFAAVIVLTFAALGGVRWLLVVLLLAGLALAYHHRDNYTKLFALLLVLAGLAVALLFELIYLRDFLDNSAYERMNTVFKFGYQAWLLMSLGSALALGDLMRAVWPFGRAAQPLPAIAAEPWPGVAPDAVPAVAPARASDETDQVVGWGLRGAWLAILAVLLVGSLIFDIEGTQARVADPQVWAQVVPPQNPLHATPSLDGFAYMYSWYPGDAAAITWINEHIGGDPVILEASQDPYEWFGRVSIYTGLPAVEGWASHESQQRYVDEAYARQPDIAIMYGSGDAATVLALLHRYDVRYVYVGQLECLVYAMHDPQPVTPTAANVQACAAASDLAGPLAVFGTMTAAGTLTVAYQRQGVTIYEVVG